MIVGKSPACFKKTPESFTVFQHASKNTTVISTFKLLVARFSHHQQLSTTYSPITQKKNKNKRKLITKTRSIWNNNEIRKVNEFIFPLATRISVFEASSKLSTLNYTYDTRGKLCWHFGIMIIHTRVKSSLRNFDRHSPSANRTHTQTHIYTTAASAVSAPFDLCWRAEEYMCVYVWVCPFVSASENSAAQTVVICARVAHTYTHIHTQHMRFLFILRWKKVCLTHIHMHTYIYKHNKCTNTFCIIS